MATVSSPYGLKPIQRHGGRYNGTRRAFNVTTNNSTGIFFGDIVNVGSGVPIAGAASPTTTRGTSTPVGVFVGCEFVDPVMGLREQQYLPANAVTAGYTKIRVFVEDDPFLLMQVQADGALTIAAIGKNAALKNFGAGSTTTGNSAVQLDSGSVATTATLAVKIIGLVNETASGGFLPAPGDAFTDVIVAWNTGVHAYLNATGA